MSAETESGGDEVGEVVGSRFYRALEAILSICAFRTGN